MSTEVARKCKACNKELVPVFPPQCDCEPCMSSFTQYDDALPITFEGGYGMLFDDIDTGDRRIIICGGCARFLIDKAPWLGLVLRN